MPRYPVFIDDVVFAAVFRWMTRLVTAGRPYGLTMGFSCNRQASDRRSPVRAYDGILGNRHSCLFSRYSSPERLVPW
jgi:hypothetical protein